MTNIPVCDDANGDINSAETEICNLIDDNCDGFIDEAGEMTTDNLLMTAIYPELGFRLKLGESFSIRMMGRYMVSSFGRQHDDWYYGLSLAFGHD